MRIWLSTALVLALTACGALPAVSSPRANAVADYAKRAPAAAPAIYNFAKVNDRLYRGGQPDDAGLAALATLGVKAVVSFQGEASDEKPIVAREKQAAAKLGLTWINMPTPLDRAPDQAYITTFFRYVRDPAHQPCYVHCRAGKDRTGTMVALWRRQFDGYNADRALAEMKSFGHDPADFPFYDALVAAFKPLPGFGAVPARSR